ncbi:UbiA family prenyltransferase [Nocardioides sp. TF02-7]|uniref:UbiA family prenyltransferase n=1 Tax=Nocardioides sp. TF02-7 TaxID=2917724 RepID=UPI001F0664ED|nr:UbiA family prenyltransferase [Nocardioides sp. TF02-7]UMG94458.1 UbiA family prenyltransferase [Nocardioides sp. TF02-7]
MSRLPALLRAAHLGPTLAVTTIAAAYGVSVGLPASSVVLVAAAVLTGQLSVGWSNDLVDVARDRAAGRTDKPFATGEVPLGVGRGACGAAVLLTVVLSVSCGLVAGLVHLGCVAAAWAYNLGLKATVVSFVPYAAAFGALPVFVTLAGPDVPLPGPWLVVAAALLGVGAHLVNALPDLRDDEAAGVRGLPHRLGERPSAWTAVAVLVCASVAMVLGAGAVPTAVVVAVLAVVALLAGLALVSHGRTPFRAAVGIALVDVFLVVLV